MESVLNKLYYQNEEFLVKDILHQYEHEQYAVINFLYFSGIVAHQLFARDVKKNNIQKNYKKALLKSDFLLPDGIALQVFYLFASLLGRIKSEKKWLSNLNGTDFVPYFLDIIRKKYGSQSLCISMYGAPEKYLRKAESYLKTKGYNIVYAQDGYSEFEWDSLQLALQEYHDTINVLLVGRSTPTNPIQELWAAKNYGKIKSNRLIVLNVGGLFDFWAGGQKRAPLWIRKIKLEWLYRLITDPKRNIKKVKNSLSIFGYIFHYLLLKKS